MSETVKRIFIFIAGAGLGAIATWQFLKNKYEQIANEEIASVKEAYNKKDNISSEESEEDESQKKKKKNGFSPQDWQLRAPLPQ